MRSHLLTRCTGSVLIEWLVGAMAIMLVSALALEGAHWYITRQIANIALMEAARAGSREHARPDAIRRAFLQAMRARFASPDGQARSRMEAFFKTVRSRSGEPAWRIDQISPNASDFAAWHDPTAKVVGAGARKVLRHDGEQGDGTPRWLDGSMPRPPSRSPHHLTSQHADQASAIHAGRTLRLSLTYLQPVLVPGLSAILKWLAPDKTMPGAHASGMLVIRTDISMEMQSHAVQWGNGIILPQD